MFGRRFGQFGLISRVVLISSLFLFAVPAYGIDYVAYYKDALDWAVYKGIIDDTSQEVGNDYDEYAWFRPYDTVKRAEMAKTIVKAVGIEVKKGLPRMFLDVSEEDWYFDYVNTARDSRFLRGYTDSNGVLTGFFGPKDDVTRAAMAKVIAGAYEFKTLPCDRQFPDVDYGAWYAPFIDSMCAANIMRGDGKGFLRPADGVTRAEFITILFRAAGEPKVDTVSPPDDLAPDDFEVTPEPGISPELDIDAVPDMQSVTFPDFDSQVYNNFARLRAPTGNCLDGSCAVHVAQFAFTTTYDGITLKDFTLRNDDNSANFSGRFGTFFLVHEGKVIDTASFNDSGGIIDGTVSFTGFSHTLVKNKRHKLNMLAEIHDIDTAEQSGAFLKLYIESPSAINAISATNGLEVNSSNIDVDAGPTGDHIQTHIARKSYPVVESDLGSIQNRIYSRLTNTKVYQFKMSAHPKGDIEWSKLTFAVEETAGISSSNYKLYIGSSLNSLSSGADVSSGKVTITPANPVRIPAGETVTFVLKADIDLSNTVQSQNLSLTLTAASDSSLTTGTSSALSSSDFIWSDISDRSHGLSTSDWTNGFEVDTFDFDTINIGYQGTGS